MLPMRNGGMAKIAGAAPGLTAALCVFALGLGVTLTGGADGQTQAACADYEQVYAACIATGQRVYDAAPLGAGDFGYIGRCNADRRQAAEHCHASGASTAPTPPSMFLETYPNQVRIEPATPPQPVLRDCMTAEQIAAITPEIWTRGSFLPPCPGAERAARERSNGAAQPPGQNLAACADATNAVHSETRRLSGPGTCDGEVALFLTNTTSQRATCSYDFEGTDGRWSGGMTGVAAGARIGGERSGLSTCGGTGRVRYACHIQADWRRDLECPARLSPGGR